MVAMRRAPSGAPVLQVTGLPTRVWPPPHSFGSEGDGSSFLTWSFKYVQSNAQSAGSRRRLPRHLNRYAKTPRSRRPRPR
ncbi:hypothetical protein IMF27_08060 [Pseudomonas sp. PCH199]|nr:hypothetical protein [Pseudomonas sp. PCH199]